VTLAIHRERTADGLLVRFVGDFDPRMAGAITQAILSTAESSVVVDVSGLGSLDGSGVRALVEARDHLANEGKALTILGASDDVLTAIDVSPLSDPGALMDEPLDLGRHGGKQRRGIRQR
jgi:anti-anti-sigma factor